MIETTVQLLEHPENRIKEESSELISIWCKSSPETYLKLEMRLLKLFTSYIKNANLSASDIEHQEKLKNFCLFEKLEENKYSSPPGSSLEAVIKAFTKSASLLHTDELLKFENQNIENLLAVAWVSVQHIGKHIRRAG
jgi:hypothetical protein